MKRYGDKNIAFVWSRMIKWVLGIGGSEFNPMGERDFVKFYIQTDFIQWKSDREGFLKGF